MSRCSYLDGWFNEESKKVDSEEKKRKIDFVTGKPLTKKQAWARVFRGKGNVMVLPAKKRGGRTDYHFSFGKRRKTIQYFIWGKKRGKDEEE